MKNIDIIDISKKCCNIIFDKDLSFDKYDLLSDKYFALEDRLYGLLKRHNTTRCELGEFTSLYSDEYNVLYKDFEVLYEELQNHED